MGSAVEIHAAWAARRTILAVAPGSMAQNWVVRSYADRVFPSIAELHEWLCEAAPVLALQDDSSEEEEQSCYREAWSDLKWLCSEVSSAASGQGLRSKALALLAATLVALTAAAAYWVQVLPE